MFASSIFKTTNKLPELGIFANFCQSTLFVDILLKSVSSTVMNKGKYHETLNTHKTSDGVHPQIPRISQRHF